MVSGVWIPKGLRKHLSFSSSQHQQQRILAKSSPPEYIRILQIYNSTGNLYYWQLLMQKEKTKLCSNTDGMVDSRQSWQTMYTLHVILSSFFVAFWASNFACRFKKTFTQDLQLLRVGAVQSILDYSHTSGVTIGSAKCVIYHGWFTVTIQCAS